MKKILLMLILGSLLPTACAPTTAGTGIGVENPWARSAMKGSNGAAYMLLQNHSKEDEALIGVSSNVAEAAEIHLSQIKADGTMEMIPQESIPLPAGGEVEFKPGSYHVMLIGLKQDLKAGDEISLTLNFKHHEDMILNVPVMDAEGMDGHQMP